MFAKKVFLLPFALILLICCSENTSETFAVSENAFEPLPACEVQGLDNCLEARGKRVFELSKSIKSKTPLQDAFEIACGAGDAEACLAYSGMLEGENGFMSDLTLLQPETFIISEEKSLKIAKQSCELNSIFGCGSVAIKLSKLLEKESNASAELARDAFFANKKSCALGSEEACDLVAFYAYPVDAEAWPSGPRSFYLEIRDQAEARCDLGSSRNCYEQAVFALQAGQREGGSNEEIQLGLNTLKELCTTGDIDSCNVHQNWTKNLP